MDLETIEHAAWVLMVESLLGEQCTADGGGA